MRTDSITINNDGIFESCETMVFDDPKVEVADLLYVLQQIDQQDARIQLMEYQKIQLIKMSNGLYVLAPMDWEGWNSDNEADIDVVSGGPDRVQDSDTESNTAEIREDNNCRWPADHEICVTGGK